ncbi:tyrosine-type recombinase/integrase [Cellvibrio sp. NN19]|uniref:tyrosine-type recombinase/integrase n=1 Tax=Cellvibrio chitinivorans TaxID=3102792 RepID=UPI002B4060DD|nr:tyrosine-type recombinase/integrase [Cellvibrio sp. NN19]
MYLLKSRNVKIGGLFGIYQDFDQESNSKMSGDHKPMLFIKKEEILSDEHSLAATDLTSPRNITNPAFAYLRSLGSVKSQKTMYSFLNIVAGLVDDSCNVSNFNWGALRRHHIHSVIGLLRESGRSPATINTYLSALKGVALEAWTLGQLDTDSFQHIKLIKTVKGFRLPKGRSLSKAEIDSLFSVCGEDPLGYRDAAIMAVLIGCGLRRAEIVSLDLESINKMDHSFNVSGKGNKERLAFMPSGTWTRLNEYLTRIRGNLPGPLFYRIRRFGLITNERMTDQAIYHILETRRVEAGVDPFSPHDLRRSFATMMLENGEDIITVKDAMGHASVLTTQKYDRRSDNRLRKAASAIDI